MIKWREFRRNFLDKYNNREAIVNQEMEQIIVVDAIKFKKQYKFKQRH